MLGNSGRHFFLCLVLVVSSGLPIFGVGTITVSPTSVSFGNVTPNWSPGGQKTITVKNTGSVNVQITSLTVTGVNAAQFEVGGLTLAKTLMANQTATFIITFLPTAVATYNATIVVGSTASIPQIDMAVSGTGYYHKTILTWSAASQGDDSNAIAGYNVYRFNGTGTASAPVCSTPGAGSLVGTNLNGGTVIVGTTYTDGPQTTPGAIYCYVATTVDTAANESGYSSPPVPAVVPTP